MDLIEILFQKIVNAVAYLHSKKIVHGDIKTANIMVTSKLSVKLIDFGYSVSLSCHKDKIDNYSGTPVYLSPQIIKKQPYNGKY